MNAALGDASPFMRIAAMRWLSSVLGVLAVFCAWLLAAQVFRREWLQLTVAALVALQPMIAFLSGIVSNDIAVTAGFTAAVAMLLFIQRERPVGRAGGYGSGARGARAAREVDRARVAAPGGDRLCRAGGRLAAAPPRGRSLRGARARASLRSRAGWWYVRSAVA